MPRQRYQTARLFRKGKRRKQWYGRYYLYVVDEQRKERRKFKLAVLGAVSELTRSEARRKLQGIIDRETAQPGAKPDPATHWEDFISKRYLPIREPRWKPRTKQTTRNRY